MRKIYLLIAVSFLFCSTIFGQPKAQRLVLIEQLTQASCGYCPAANATLKTLVNGNPGKVIDLKYQVSWPGYDPMYLENTADPTARVNYYGTTGVPETQMDGTKMTTIPTQTQLNTEYAVTSPFTINVSHTMASDYDSIYITVVVTATEAISGTLKLRTSIIEKQILYDTPPGSNGETEFNNVCRKFLPNAAGTTLATSWTNGQTETFTFNVPLPTYLHDINQVGVICFIQDDATKNVKQAGYSAPQPLVLDGAITSLTNVPLMQCTSTFDPTCVLKNIGSVALTSATISYKIDNGTPSTFAWTGNLAQNQTATVNLPTVTAGAGSHTFTVSVIELNGTPDLNLGNSSKTKSFSIASESTPAPLAETFAATTFPPAGWIVNNPDGGATWTRKTSAGANSTTTCAKVDFYNSTSGNQDDLILKPLDFTGMTSVSLSFYVAYAQYSSENDRIQLQVSTDCGTTWTTKWDKAGTTLSTSAATTSSFTPTTAAQWRLENVNLNTYDGQTGCFIRFHAISAYGNNGYVDEINITGNTTAVENVASDVKNIMIYPNPTDGLVYIYNASNSEISLYNVLGKQVLTVSKASNVNTLDLSGLAQGNYFVKISNGKEVVTRKIVLTK